MSTQFEDLIVLQKAEQLTDGVWQVVVQWDDFAKDVLGRQLVRASDSIGANIAEAFGRYNYGAKIHFLYYARGSLYETKYWLNRGVIRVLLTREWVESQTAQLTEVSRLVNAYVASPPS